MLTPGTQVGGYEILGTVGAGGMGEVYRAHDPTLDRIVAIKILPAEFARDDDRLRRFQLEARAVSALNHPNVLTVHGFGTHETTAFLVTELLEGSDLRREIDRGPVPLRRAIGYAQQIADGLAAAHDKGIVHRDLKPDNIFVTGDGRVKILDFGLAKVGGLASGLGSEQVTQPLTGAGLVMGTVGYMSPEQVRGQNADQRSDLFSFGVVLYELVSGRRAFAGETGAETLAALLKDEPPELLQLVPSIPPAVEKIVRRCLEKSPERRFRSAHDLSFALSTIPLLSDGRTPQSEALKATPGEAKTSSRRGERLAWLASSILLVMATLFAAPRLWPPEPQVDTQRLRLSVLLPEVSAVGAAALSPDGRWLAFPGATGARVQLWVHALDGTSTRPLAGTDGAVLPFWSPDSRVVGFFASGKLRRIDASGGVATTLADVAVATGGTWSRDGIILFSMLGGAGLSQVPAGGGPVVTVARPDINRQETDFLNPFFLPDGRRFLYNVFSGQADRRGIFLGSLDGTTRKRLLADNSNAVYAPLPAGGGVVLFARGGALLAQPLDPDKGDLGGEPVAVADYVGTIFDGSSFGMARRNFTASHTGLLVLNHVDRQSSQLVWADRTGAGGVVAGFSNVMMARLSPDGRRFAVARMDTDQSGNGDLWIADSSGANASRLTFDPANDVFPVWSHDGRLLRWASNRDGVYHIWEKAADGSGQDHLLFKTAAMFKFPTDWSRDGGTMIYRQVDPKTGYDIWFTSVAPDGKELTHTPFLQTPANEAAAVLSPSAKWLAYASDESGRYEVYVQSFPGGGGKRQISAAGGGAPHWRGDGRELFFHALDGKLMAVPVVEEPTITTGEAVALFEFRPGGNLITPYYSVSADGQRFLLSTIVDNERAAPLAVLVNWPATLQRSQ